MLDRRSFLGACIGFALGAGLDAAWAAERRRLVVMTSYPQEVISRYVDAFGRRFPGTEVSVVWHSGRDAADYLLGEGKGQVDVYWSPSMPTFAALRDKGAFRKLTIDRRGLPGRLGHQDIADPQGYFLASEIAGYGVAVNPDYLRRHGLPVPREWADLAGPRYAGHLVMPVPSRIGFAPAITEIVLQAEGWTAGWALLARIAANASLLAGHGDEVLGAVAKGEQGLAMTIDFFAAQAIVRGAPLDFVYPHANAFEPANIAIPATAPHRRAAEDWVTFVLSAEGQRLLIDPDLRRLAIRPAVYRQAPKGYFNPWASSFARQLSFDNALFARRRDLDTALFDCLIFAPQPQTAPLWQAVRRLQARSGLPEAAQAALGEAAVRLTSVPVDETTATALAGGFSGRGERRTTTPEAAGALARWQAAVAADVEAAGRAVARAEDLAGAGQ